MNFEIFLIQCFWINFVWFFFSFGAVGTGLRPAREEWDGGTADSSPLGGHPHYRPEECTRHHRNRTGIQRQTHCRRGQGQFRSLFSCCSDFRYESNGIFVLGVGFFFLQTNFDFLTSHFWRNFFISFESYCCLELKFEKIFHLWSFFVKLWGFKDCHFGQFGTINAR